MDKMDIDNKMDMSLDAIITTQRGRGRRNFGAARPPKQHFAPYQQRPGRQQIQKAHRRGNPEGVWKHDLFEGNRSGARQVDLRSHIHGVASNSGRRSMHSSGGRGGGMMIDRLASSAVPNPTPRTATAPLTIKGSAANPILVTIENLHPSATAEDIKV